MRAITFLITAAVATLLAWSNAQAFDITPTVSLIELPRQRGGVTVLLRNPRTVPLPVVFEIHERAIAENGAEQTTPADELFQILPPQVVVPPGGTQAVRLQWLAPPPATSRSFTLFAAEVPVDLSNSAASQLQTLLKMGASVHIAAARSQPRPVLLSAQDTQGGVDVTLGNEGDRYFYIDTVALDFNGKRITGIELANAAGRTLVPPGARRTFTIENVSGKPALVSP
jgi:fimbrial chaperone protein